MPSVGINNYIRALRLPFITASILPYILGSCLNKNNFNCFNYLIGLVCVMATHLSANLINDYADSRSGVDWQDMNFFGFFGGSKLIQEKVLSEKFYLKYAVLFASIALVCAILLAISLKSILVIGFFIAILGLALSYSVKPFQFSYHRLGELAVFTLFGPALVMGGYFAQTAVLFSSRSFMLSLPAGLLTAAILFANEVPDFSEDIKTGKYTWVSIVGIKNSYILYYLLAFLAFFAIALNIVLGYIPASGFLIFVFSAVAFRAAEILKKYPNDKTRLVESSRLTVLLHGLIIVSLILAVAL